MQEGGVKKKLKPETGDRKGRGEQLVKDAEILDGGWWISDSEKIISTNSEPRVVAKTATGGNGGIRKF